MKHGYNAKTSPFHFYVKTKILVDFHTYISVPLNDYCFVLKGVQLVEVNDKFS